jgi:hypothetical protein
MALVRIIAAGLVTLALVIGPGWQRCAAFHQGRPASAAPGIEMALQGHAHHRHTDHGHTSANDDGAPDAGLVTAADKDRTSSNDNGCQKCCAACIPTSPLPRNSEWTWAPAASRIFFDSLSAQLRGRIVFVDPDIPKHVA